MSETMTTEERKARRAERRAERMKGTSGQRLVLFLDPALQARLALLAQANGRSPMEEATAAVEALLKSAATTKAVATAKASAKAKIEADREAADRDFAARLALIESL